MDLLAKPHGDKMTLIKISHDKAVLVLTDREETAGPFFEYEGRFLPIIKFERPPELCGVEEPTDPAAFTDLLETTREEFVSALIEAAQRCSVTTILCAGVDNPKADPYRHALEQVTISLSEYRPQS